MTLLGTRERMGVAALLLAASTFLSRLMGLIRDKVISWQFGAGQEADLYFAAFVVPDCINYLLAGGFMSITIIPLLARAFADESAQAREDAWKFFSCCLTWMFLASLTLTLVCAFLAEPLARLVAPGFTELQTTRLAFFMRIILPAQIFFLTGACATALLFLRRQFRVPALAPLIYNAAIILGGLSIPLLASLISGRTYAEESAELGMTGYCIGVTVGAFLGAFLLPFSVAKQGGLSLHLTFTHPLMRRFCLVALPLMLGQTIVMLDEQLLRVFGSLLQEGTVSLLNYARRISQVPVGLVGQAAAVASYPFLVSRITEKRFDEVQSTLQTALQTSLALSIPCAAYMCATSWSIITILFQGGRFGPAETQATIPLLQIMLLAVPFWICYAILVRAFYAYQNTITPTVQGTLVTLCVLPIYWFVVQTGDPRAIAATSTLSILMTTLWLIALWRRRYLPLPGLGHFALRVLACTLPALLITAKTHELLRAYLPFGPLVNALLALMLCGCVFLLGFLPVAWKFLPLIRERVTALLRKKT